MKMEWLRAGDSTPACWACFMIFDDHAEVLAVIGANERIDDRMTLTDARKLWSDLKQRGWYRATDEEINHHQMSHRALRRIAYGRGGRRRGGMCRKAPASCTEAGGRWGLSSHRRRAARCGAWGDLYPGRPVAAATTRKRRDCSI